MSKHKSSNKPKHSSPLSHLTKDQLRVYVTTYFEVQNEALRNFLDYFGEDLELYTKSYSNNPELSNLMSENSEKLLALYRHIAKQIVLFPDLAQFNRLDSDKDAYERIVDCYVNFLHGDSQAIERLWCSHDGVAILKFLNYFIERFGISYCPNAYREYTQAEFDLLQMIIQVVSMELRFMTNVIYESINDDLDLESFVKWLKSDKVRYENLVMHGLNKMSQIIYSQMMSIKIVFSMMQSLIEDNLPQLNARGCSSIEDAKTMLDKEFMVSDLYVENERNSFFILNERLNAIDLPVADKIVLDNRIFLFISQLGESAQGYCDLASSDWSEPAS